MSALAMDARSVLARVLRVWARAPFRSLDEMRASMLERANAVDPRPANVVSIREYSTWRRIPDKTRGRRRKAKVIAFPSQ